MKEKEPKKQINSNKIYFMPGTWVTMWMLSEEWLSFFSISQNTVCIYIRQDKTQLLGYFVWEYILYIPSAATWSVNLWLNYYHFLGRLTSQVLILCIYTILISRSDMFIWRNNAWMQWTHPTVCPRSKDVIGVSREEVYKYNSIFFI